MESVGGTGDLTGVALTTGRLVLTAPTAADIDAIVRICQDEDIQAWTTVPSPYTRADAEKFVCSIMPRGLADGTDVVFGLYHATSGELLGLVGLHGLTGAHARDGAQGKIGYWAAPEARGRGYMTEAVRAVCRWAFAELGLVRIEWMAMVGNDASRRVAEKAGFVLEGTLRGRHVRLGRRTDTWVGSLLPGDAP